MEGLKHKLENFTLSETSRKEILKSNTDKEYVPSEFIEIAKVALAGHFLVNDKISVHPTAVEFYYHEESNDGIKDPIVYHRNSKKGSKSIFNFGILHNHVSGIDITFEHGDSPGRTKTVPQCYTKPYINNHPFLKVYLQNGSMEKQKSK